MTSRRWPKWVFLALLASGAVIGLRVVVALARLLLELRGDDIPLEWFPSWWIGWSAVGGAAWLLTRDAVFEARVGAPKLVEPLSVASALWGAFAGMAWFSCLAFLAGDRAMTPVSLCMSFRPLYRASNLVSCGVVVLMAGGIGYWLIRGVAGARPPATAGPPSARES